MKVLLDLPNELLELIIEYAIDGAHADVSVHYDNHGKAGEARLSDDRLTALEQTSNMLRLVNSRFAACTARLMFEWSTITMKASEFTGEGNKFWDRITCPPMRAQAKHLQIVHRSECTYPQTSHLYSRSEGKAARKAWEKMQKEEERSLLRGLRGITAKIQEASEGQSPSTMQALARCPLEWILHACKRFGQSIVPDQTPVVQVQSGSSKPFAKLRTMHADGRASATLLPYLLLQASSVTDVAMDLAGEGLEESYWVGEMLDEADFEAEAGIHHIGGHLRSVVIDGFGADWDIDLLKSWCPKTSTLRLASYGVELDYYLAIRAIKAVGAWSGFKRLEWLMYRCDIGDDNEDRHEERMYMAEDCSEWRSAIAELQKAWAGRKIEMNTWEGKGEWVGVSDAPPAWTRCEYWVKEDATIVT